MRHILVCLLFLLALASLSAQYPGWTNYTCGPDAQDIAFSGNYAWVATSGGLVRIDQSSLEIAHFNHANSGLPGNNIDGIARDEAGNIWLRYMNSLVKYDGSSWQTFFSPYGGFTCMDIAPDGTIWLGTDSGGLIRFDGTTFTQFTNFSNHDHPEARNVTVDGLGRVWFSTNYLYIDDNNFAEFLPGALMYYNGSTFTIFSPAFSTVTSNGISDLAFDAANRLWVGTSGGGIWKHEGFWTNINAGNSGLASDYVFHLTFDIQGNLWVSHLEGLDCFDSAIWHAYTPANSELPSTHIWSIAADTYGSVWIGCQEGLVRIRNQAMLVLQLSNSGFSSLRTRNQALDAGGTHWFANQLGLDTFDGEDWGHLDLPGDDDYLRDLEFDTQGRLWLASEYQGLLCYDGNQFITYHSSNSSLPSNAINNVEIDPQDRIWLGMPYNGVACYDGAAWTLYNSSNSALPTNKVTTLAADQSGRIWIGCFDQPNHLGGLAVLDGENWTFYDSSNSGLPSILVKSVEVRDGIAWIATEGGLARFDGANWELWTTQNSGLPNDRVRDIAFDSYGHMFCSTASGGLAHYDGNWWTNWTSNNSGLPDNYPRSLLIAPGNQVWICNTSNGVTVFDHGATPSLDPVYVPASQVLRTCPNPFSDRISFDGWSERGEIRIALFNLRGQKLAQWDLPAGRELTLDLADRGLADLPAGIYLWRLSSETGSAWCRSVKCE